MAAVHRRAAAIFLHGEQIIGRLHEGDRVDGAAVDPDLIMQMAAGRTAGGAHAADDLAASDALAGSDCKRRKVAVAGFDAAAVVELDQIAIAAAVVACFGNDAVGGRVNWRSDRARKVDAGMHGSSTAE